MKKLLGLFLSLSLLISSSVYADDNADGIAAVQLVDSAISKMLQELNQRKDEIKTDDTVVPDILRRQVVPYFDVVRMSKISLGKYWRKLTTDQKRQFLARYTELVIDTYSKAFGSYNGERVEIVDKVSKVRKGKTTVRTRILRDVGAPVSINYKMYTAKSGMWKVYDVQIEGISMVSSYKSQFSSTIKKDGINGLMEKLGMGNG
ncbi:MlaC/ttg2D family ABC transporter substrate-binding protein [Pelagibaculum spongiae]|uniref:Toluene tolerance protein n=1 Tax=Pelagibaculum spongiae TaxID=2080658 RepID=A0A2V1GXU5_9GAMM|nr:ABC transporter substrate-binding protein [Pelagibaculum spongiae]PVZ71914.1 hypothetical protein DC094_02510 [Pelagibaculum spongiae]